MAKHHTPRISCRDTDGNARLLDGANIMDAIEQLCRFEDAIFGPLVNSGTEHQYYGSCGGKMTQQHGQEKRSLLKTAEVNGK